MQSPKAWARAALRAAVRRLVPMVSSRPWLVALASRMFAVAPGLKRRLRHFVSTPAPLGLEESDLTPRQAAVLVDLRQAIRSRTR